MWAALRELHSAKRAVGEAKGSLVSSFAVANFLKDPVERKNWCLKSEYQSNTGFIEPGSVPLRSMKPILCGGPGQEWQQQRKLTRKPRFEITKALKITPSYHILKSEISPPVVLTLCEQ